MFWFAEAAEATAEHAEEAEHQAPIVVQLVNSWFGEAVLRFELAYTKPLWDKFLGYFGTNAESAFGPYTAENAIPWYTVMFFIACILSVVIIWILKGKLSESEPGGGQRARSAQHGRRHHWTTRFEILPGRDDVCGADPGVEPDGTVSAVHDADIGDERDVCARLELVPLLQLHRHQREWFIRSSETPGWSNLVDCAADLSDRVN